MIVRNDQLTVSKQDLLNAGGRDAWIEMQRGKGEFKRAERESLKGAGAASGDGDGDV